MTTADDKTSANRVIDDLQERIRLAHAYCDDPDNWSAYDRRGKLLAGILDGTFKSLPIKKVNA